MLDFGAGNNVFTVKFVESPVDYLKKLVLQATKRRYY